MLLEFILLLAIGLLFCFFGIRIWKFNKIKLIHDYHYKNVADEDKKAYSEKMGIGVLVIGVGIVASGVTDFFTNSAAGWVFFVGGFIAAIIIFTKTQKKYNKGFGVFK